MLVHRQQAEARKWINESIRIVAEPFPSMGAAPEWIDLVRRELVDRYGGDALYELGARVEVTMDLELPNRPSVAKVYCYRSCLMMGKRSGYSRAKAGLAWGASAMTRGKSSVPTAKSAELASSAFTPRTTGTSLCAPVRKATRLSGGPQRSLVPDARRLPQRWSGTRLQAPQ